MTTEDDLDKLQSKLKDAREDFDEEYNPPPPAPGTTVDPATSRVGYEFLAHVISGGLIGFFIDKFFGTLPWGMVAMTVMGFVSGVYRANKVMKTK